MEEKIVEQGAQAKLSKTWTYTEKLNKHVTHHTLSIQGKRFSHQAEIKEASQMMRQRTDFNLDNVRAVNSYYGLSRNIVLTIILAILALAGLVLAVVGIAGDAGIALLIVGLVVAAVFALLAVLVYRKTKPAFILEIETAVPMGETKTNSFAYGSASINFGKKRHSFLFYIFLIVLFPIGILYLLFHSKGNKYKFAMDAETGLDIVDTIGQYLIKE